MRTIKDSQGREYRFEITPLSIERVREIVGVNLYALLENEMALFRELETDIGKTIKILYVLCCRQDTTPTMPESDFWRAFVGQALGNAIEAFFDEYLDFFPNRRVAETLQKAMSKAKETRSILLDEANQNLDKNDAASLAKTLKTKFGGSPE
jgi:hypothetical protein